MKTRTTLGIALLASTLACNTPRVYVTGTVVAESGSVTQIVPSYGALFSNESVKFHDPSYRLTIDINDGGAPFAFDVEKWHCGSNSFSKPLELLADQIEIGSQVTIPDPRHEKARYWGVRADNDRLGRINSGCIRVGRK